MTTVDRTALATRYPQFGLQLVHHDLALVPPGDEELRPLAAIVASPGGVTGEDEAHFLTWPTGDADAVDAFLAFHHELRVPPTPERWLAPFAVTLERRPVGVVALESARWVPDRTVATRAWLARDHQGRGLGRRARAMLLELAFTHLGAAGAVTTAAADNAASRRVSERLGYRATARHRGPDGVVEVHYALDQHDWRPHRLADVRVTGVARFRAAIEPGRRTSAGPAPPAPAPRR